MFSFNSIGKSVVFIGLWGVFSALGAGADGQWTARSLPSPDGSIQDVVFPTEKTGWICGFFAGVLRTTDGGVTWMELPSNLTTEKIASITFVDEARGWAVATSYAGREPRQVILSTSDGGNSWTVQNEVEGGVVHLVSIWFLNDHLGWAVGGRDNDPLILRTVNGGSTWSEVTPESSMTHEIRRIRFADSLHGWALGPAGIFYSYDGGIHWTEQYSNGSAVWLNDLALLSPEEAFAVGGRGFILHTADRGATWSRVAWPGDGDDFLWAVAFADNKNGWIVGAKGAIFLTRDGGQSWQRQVSPVQGMLADVAATRSHVFITGDSARVLTLQR